MVSLLTLQIIAFEIIASVPLASAGCGIPGVVGGECARLFKNDECKFETDVEPFFEYEPKCDNSCLTAVDYKSVLVNGNGFVGTDCRVYSDTECQNELGASGNIVSTFGGERCLMSSDGGFFKSLKCFFNCNSQSGDF